MELTNFLSDKVYEMFDSYSGKPVAWYRVVKDMPTHLFNQNRHRIEYIGDRWGYIEKSITREECIEKYGEITHEEYGPRGGWKSVTFGVTTFRSNRLRPKE
jgi:hypothetical protein